MEFEYNKEALVNATMLAGQSKDSFTQAKDACVSLKNVPYPKRLESYRDSISQMCRNMENTELSIDNLYNFFYVDINGILENMNVDFNLQAEADKLLDDFLEQQKQALNAEMRECDSVVSYYENQKKDAQAEIDAIFEKYFGGSTYGAMGRGNYTDIKLYNELSDEDKRKIAALRAEINIAEQKIEDAKNEVEQLHDAYLYYQESQYLLDPDFSSKASKGKTLYEQTGVQANAPVRGLTINMAQPHVTTNYNYLTDSEKDMLGYYFSIGGREAAEHYLKSKEDEINYRSGLEKAELYDNAVSFVENVSESIFGESPSSDVIETIGETLVTAGFSGAAGVDMFFQGMEQLTTEEAVGTSSWQVASSLIRSELNTGQGFVWDMGTAVGNMAPGIIASVAVSAIPGVGPAASGLVGSTLLGLSAGGNAYNEALLDGYSIEAARKYGLVTGLAEGGMQYVLGGIGSLGGVATKAVGGSITNAATRNIASNNARNFLSKYSDYALGSLGEGTEEYIQGALGPVIRNVTLGENNEVKLIDREYAYQALLGMATAGIFNGSVVVNDVASLGKYATTYGVDANLLMINPSEYLGAVYGASQYISNGDYVNASRLMNDVGDYEAASMIKQDGMEVSKQANDVTENVKSENNSVSENAESEAVVDNASTNDNTTTNENNVTNETVETNNETIQTNENVETNNETVQTSENTVSNETTETTSESEILQKFDDRKTSLAEEINKNNEKTEASANEFSKVASKLSDENITENVDSSEKGIRTEKSTNTTTNNASSYSGASFATAGVAAAVGATASTTNRGTKKGKKQKNNSEPVIYGKNGKIYVNKFKQNAKNKQVETKTETQEKPIANQIAEKIASGDINLLNKIAGIYKNNNNNDMVALIEQYVNDLNKGINNQGKLNRIIGNITLDLQSGIHSNSKTSLANQLSEVLNTESNPTEEIKEVVEPKKVKSSTKYKSSVPWWAIDSKTGMIKERYRGVSLDTLQKDNIKYKGIVKTLLASTTLLPTMPNLALGAMKINGSLWHISPEGVQTTLHSLNEIIGNSFSNATFDSASGIWNIPGVDTAANVIDGLSSKLQVLLTSGAVITPTIRGLYKGIQHIKTNIGKKGKMETSTIKEAMAETNNNDEIVRLQKSKKWAEEQYNNAPEQSKGLYKTMIEKLDYRLNQLEFGINNENKVLETIQKNNQETSNIQNETEINEETATVLGATVTAATKGFKNTQEESSTHNKNGKKVTRGSVSKLDSRLKSFENKASITLKGLAELREKINSQETGIKVDKTITLKEQIEQLIKNNDTVGIKSFLNENHSKLSTLEMEQLLSQLSENDKMELVQNAEFLDSFYDILKLFKMLSRENALKLLQSDLIISRANSSTIEYISFNLEVDETFVESLFEKTSSTYHDKLLSAYPILEKINKNKLNDIVSKLDVDQQYKLLKQEVFISFINDFGLELIMNRLSLEQKFDILTNKYFSSQLNPKNREILLNDLHARLLKSLDAQTCYELLSNKENRDELKHFFEGFVEKLSENQRENLLKNEENKSKLILLLYKQMTEIERINILENVTGEVFENLSWFMISKVLNKNEPSLEIANRIMDVMNEKNYKLLEQAVTYFEEYKDSILEGWSSQAEISNDSFNEMINFVFKNGTISMNQIRILSKISKSNGYNVNKQYQRVFDLYENSFVELQNKFKNEFGKWVSDEKINEAFAKTIFQTDNVFKNNHLRHIDKCMGYSNGQYNVINLKYDNISAILAHEAIHYISYNNNATGVKVDEISRGINEAITEFFAKIIDPSSTSGYDNAVEILSEMVDLNVFSVEFIKEAYFTNNLTMITDKINELTRGQQLIVDGIIELFYKATDANFSWYDRKKYANRIRNVVYHYVAGNYTLGKKVLQVKRVSNKIKLNLKNGLQNIKQNLNEKLLNSENNNYEQNGNDVIPEVSETTEETTETIENEVVEPTEEVLDSSELEKGLIFEETTEELAETIENEVEQPIEEVTETIESEVEQPTEEVTETIESEVEQPTEEVTETIENGVVEPTEEVTETIESEVEQPTEEVTETIESEVEQPTEEVTETIENGVVEPTEEVTETIENRVVEPIEEVTETIENGVVEPIEEVTETPVAYLTDINNINNNDYQDKFELLDENEKIGVLTNIIANRENDVSVFIQAVYPMLSKFLIRNINMIDNYILQELLIKMEINRVCNLIDECMWIQPNYLSKIWLNCDRFAKSEWQNKYFMNYSPSEFTKNRELFEMIYEQLDDKYQIDYLIKNNYYFQSDPMLLNCALRSMPRIAQIEWFNVYVSTYDGIPLDEMVFEKVLPILTSNQIVSYLDKVISQMNRYQVNEAMNYLDYYEISEFVANKLENFPEVALPERALEIFINRRHYDDKQEWIESYLRKWGNYINYSNYDFFKYMLNSRY